MDKLQSVIDRVSKTVEHVRTQAQANLHYAQGAADALKMVVDEWNSEVELPGTEKPEETANGTGQE